MAHKPQPLPDVVVEPGDGAESGHRGGGSAVITPIELDVSCLREGRVLGHGSQGRVVELVAPKGFVAKWYLSEPAAVPELVSWRQRLPRAQRSILDGMACWPRAVLRDGDRVAGTLLPTAPADFGHAVRLPSGAVRTVLSGLRSLVAGPDVLLAPPAFRLAAVAKFAQAIAFLHAYGVVLGNVSMHNTLWRATESAEVEVYLLDCDTARLEGPDSPARKEDLYQLALVAVRVLAGDAHTRDPNATAPLLGHTLLPLPRAGLSPEPAERPPASAWIYPLLNQSANMRAMTG